MTKLCICQLCNCGRHRCPHQPYTSKDNGPCKISEYSNQYVAKPIDRIESFKPIQAAIHSCDPLDDKTTHRVDYIPYDVSRRYQRITTPYKPPSGDIENLTTYVKDYPAKPLQRVVGKPQEHTRRDPGKFEGNPTYRQDFQKWPIMPNRLVSQVPAWNPPQGKLADRTSYGDNYIRHHAPPRESLRPNELAKTSDGPFDDNTCYKDAYIKHPLEAKEQREREKYNPSKAPLDDMTTFRRDYTPKSYHPVESMRPANAAYQSDAPFEDKTTNRQDFTKWPLERPYQHAHEQYQRQPGDICFDTTHNVTYTPKPQPKRELIRPSSRKRDPGNFDGSTNYKVEYQKWLVQPARAIVNEKPHISQGKFGGIPTYKRDYVAHSLPNTLSCKPATEAVNSDGPFDGHTMYRTEFTPKHVEPCPAAILNSSGRYLFVDQTAGHKWYQPVSEAITELPRPGSKSMHGTVCA